MNATKKLVVYIIAVVIVMAMANSAKALEEKDMLCIVVKGEYVYVHKGIFRVHYLDIDGLAESIGALYVANLSDRLKRNAMAHMLIIKDPSANADAVQMVKDVIEANLGVPSSTQDDDITDLEAWGMLQVT